MTEDLQVYSQHNMTEDLQFEMLMWEKAWLI